MILFLQNVYKIGSIILAKFTRSVYLKIDCHTSLSPFQQCVQGICRRVTIIQQLHFQ